MIIQHPIASHWRPINPSDPGPLFANAYTRSTGDPLRGQTIRRRVYLELGHVTSKDDDDKSGRLLLPIPKVRRRVAVLVLATFNETKNVLYCTSTVPQMG
jgi:hypothetical protein